MMSKLKTRDWFHHDGFPITVERREPQKPFGAHSHEFAELVIVTGGTGLHVVGRHSWKLATGDVFVIGGPYVHDYQGLANLKLINILFQPQKVSFPNSDLAAIPGYHVLFNLEPAWRKRHNFDSRLHLSPRELGSALGMVEELEGELKRREPGFSFMATASFMQLVGFLSRCYGKSGNPNSHALLRIAETITYLETHLHDQVKLETLTEIANMSKRSLIRAFQAATGHSPIGYWIQQRVNRAASLLREDNERTVTEIAFDCGFNDSNYFTRQFRKSMGSSPSSYRKKHLSGVRRGRE